MSYLCLVDDDAAKERRERMHALSVAYRAYGFSPTTALGMAIADLSPGYNWRIHFPPSTNDRRLLHTMETTGGLV